MIRPFRAGIAVTCSVALSACAVLDPSTLGKRPNVDGAHSLAFDAADLAAEDPAPLNMAADKLAEYKRNSLVGKYLAESDTLCSEYLQTLTQVKRDYSIAFGSLATLFGGLGAAFTQASVVRPLSALASISSAERAELDADTFAQQTAQVIIAGIKNSRARTYNTIVRDDFPKPITQWPLTLALSDVADYHSRCSLHEGITEAAASISAVAPQTVSSETASAGRSESPPPQIGADQANAAAGAAAAAAAAGASSKETAAAAAGAVAGIAANSGGATGSAPAVSAGVAAGSAATAPTTVDTVPANAGRAQPVDESKPGGKPPAPDSKSVQH